MHHKAYVLKNSVIRRKYWNYVGSLADIEDYVKTYENNEWNCEPIPYKADEYGIINNRHKMPVKNFIFSEIPFGHNSYSQMEKIAINKLKQQRHLTISSCMLLDILRLQ